LSYHLFEFAAKDLESDVKCQSQSKVPGTTEEQKSTTRPYPLQVLHLHLLLGLKSRSPKAEITMACPFLQRGLP